MLTAADGGVFSFGDAPFYGSLGATPKTRPSPPWPRPSTSVATGWSTPTAPSPRSATPRTGARHPVPRRTHRGDRAGAGYRGVHLDRLSLGQLRLRHLELPVRQLSAGAAHGLHRCRWGREANRSVTGQPLPRPARRRGRAEGLNLYAFLTYGEDASTPRTPRARGGWSRTPATSDSARALDAFAKAVAAGINAQVAWWLDVGATAAHPRGPPTRRQTPPLIQGFMDALHAEGINSVGIYASPESGTGIVGATTPAVPYWAADWGPPRPPTCTDVHQWIRRASRPGPVEMVQYGVGA